MLTSLSLFRCYSCNEELTQSDVENMDILDGMCMDCFEVSMKAAYDDIDDVPDREDDQ